MLLIHVQVKVRFQDSIALGFVKTVTMGYGYMIGPTIARTIVAATVACFAFAAQKICFNAQPYSYVVLPLASVISLPAGLLVGGAIALYTSAQKVVEAFQQGSLFEAIKPVVYSLVCAGVGLGALKYHDKIAIGLAERAFIPHLSSKLVERWSSSMAFIR